MRTLKVVDGDFVLEDGRFVVLTGTAALAQNIRNRLALWLGEWFLYPENGIDWLGLFDQKQFLQERTEIAVRNAITAAPQVDKIIRLDVEFNRSTRTITVDFEAETTEGKLALRTGVTA